MRRFNRNALIVLALLVSACGLEARKQAALKEVEVDAPASPAVAGNELRRGFVTTAQSVSGDAETAGRLSDAYTPVRSNSDAMIIRTGSASLQIDSLEIAIGRVRSLATQYGGYVANSEIQAVDGGIRTATIELRVPSERFDQLVSGLNPIGKVEHVSVSAQDVGEEYTDISARVINGRKLEARLIELIANRTGKLSDVLEIERELARVREEIERMEGRMRYLQAHAAVSSLSIQIHEPAPVVGDVGTLAVLAEAFRQAWRNSVSFTASGIAALGTLLPVALLGLLGIVAIRKAWRRLA